MRRVREHFTWVGFIWLSAGAMLATMAIHGWALWHSMRRDAADHGERLGLTDWAWQFLNTTAENWQSELMSNVWAALFGTVLGAYLYRRAQRELDRIESKIDRALARLGEDPDA